MCLGALTSRYSCSVERPVRTTVAVAESVLADRRVPFEPLKVNCASTYRCSTTKQVASFRRQASLVESIGLSVLLQGAAGALVKEKCLSGSLTVAVVLNFTLMPNTSRECVSYIQVQPSLSHSRAYRTRTTHPT